MKDLKKMKSPETPEELLAEHKLLRSDPETYLQIQSDRLRENPRNAEAYFARHYGWMEVGEPQRALEDLDKSIEIEPKQIAWLYRGHVHRHLGEYQNALDDFQHGESIDPEQWDDIWGPLYQADCHARLGNEKKSLEYWARLPEDFWDPGVYDVPAGNKTEIAEGLRRLAAIARQMRR
jgi:tetratricopeptide (TPR) repeat protein